jgi:hypothetical protein
MARERTYDAPAAVKTRGHNRAANRDILIRMNTALHPVDGLLQCAKAFAYVYFYQDLTEGRARP